MAGLLFIMWWNEWRARQSEETRNQKLAELVASVNTTNSTLVAVVSDNAKALATFSERLQRDGAAQ